MNANTNANENSNNNITTAPKTRGRVKGSTDSVLITVSELLRRFGGEAEIPVRRTWLVKRAVEEATAKALEGTTAMPPNDGDALPPNLHEVTEETEEAKVAFTVS